MPSNDEIEIVSLTPEEWPGYKALRLEALQNAPEAFSSTYADFRDKPDEYWQARLEAVREMPGSWMLFARRGADLLGMVGAYVDPSDPKVATVISVYVAASARRTGVSKRLMEAILATLRAAGLRKALLSVNAANLPAVRLYQRFGFQAARTDPHQRMGDGKYYDELYMEKEL